MVNMNAWEDEYMLQQTGTVLTSPVGFYDGLYTSSTIDVVGILLEMYNRPNPQVHVGAVDIECPLVLCDLTVGDYPIIYASPDFTKLTGYNQQEVLGINCRFLQTPPSGTKPKVSTADQKAIEKMGKAVRRNRECQVQITNYRKNGRPFQNFLTIIPVRWQSNTFNIAVGLQMEVAA